jgi:hypothetical protein
VQPVLMNTTRNSYYRQTQLRSWSAFYSTVRLEEPHPHDTACKPHFIFVQLGVLAPLARFASRASSLVASFASYRYRL